MLVALFAMTLMIFLANEVSYDTNVEYVVASQQVNRLKAYYAARSALELGLLRVHIYKQIVGQVGDKLGGQISMLDPIWNMPFIWPPSAMLPDDMNLVDKEMIESAVSESLMADGTAYSVNIVSEGSKIDLNNLAQFGELDKGLREATQAQLLKLFESALANNEAFEDDYNGYNFNELINNMTDWVDKDTESLNGGAESSLYPDSDPEFYPPNQPFKTLEEIRMVAGMNDDFYSLLLPRVTVYGAKGINVNYANKETIMSLDQQITDEIASEIIKRRDNPEEGGLFSNSEDFEQFLSSLGVNTDSILEKGVPLYFDTEFNFRVEATGQFANVVRKITAITFDLESAKTRLTSLLDEAAQEEGEEEEDESGSGTGSDSDSDLEGDSDEKKEEEGEEGQDQTDNSPPSRPRIVYWWEN